MFGETVWSISTEKVKEEEVKHVLKDAMPIVGAGVMYLDGVKSKRLEVFVEVLKERQRFVELGWSSIDKV